MFSTVVEPVLVSATLPVVEPADGGWNVMLKVTLCPAPSVVGMLNPLMLKPAPDTPAAVMSRLLWPVFVNVLVSVWLVPKPTLPKPTLTGEELNCPGVGGVTASDLALIPWQPTSIVAGTRASRIRVQWGICLMKLLKERVSQINSD